MTAGYTFDAGALIAVDRDDRRIAVLIGRATERGGTVTVPATALAQVIRAPQRQVRLMRFIRRRSTRVVALDGAVAPRVGRLLAVSGTSDVVDAHVVVCARGAGQTVITSDPGDLRLLDPTLPVFAL
jgi:hypothetical protein